MGLCYDQKVELVTTKCLEKQSLFVNLKLKLKGRKLSQKYNIFEKLVKKQMCD